MAEVYYDGDIDLELIRCRRIAVVGYGNQGTAHALNLRDSGCDVHIGVRMDGRGRTRAVADGFAVHSVAAAAEWADVVSVLLPDHVHKQVFEESIRPHAGTGKMLLVAHGFSIHYRQMQPPADMDVALVAPVGPGKMLRNLFVAGSGVPAVFAVYQDGSGRAESLALAYAQAIGCARAGVMRTTDQEETETDLFGEQAVLCGGLSALIRAGYDVLVEAGYQPRLAYLECIQQVKLIADLIYESGLAGMNAQISDTAEFGAFVSGPRIINDRVRESMRSVLTDIQSGAFAQAWVKEYESGADALRARRAWERQQPVEAVGDELRSLMKMPDEAPS